MRNRFAGRRVPALIGLGACLLLSGRAAPAAEEGVTFYVSPAGDDAWSGRLAEPKADRTDGPFATVGRARDAARAGRAKGATIALRGGTYALTEPLVLTPQDSGSPERPLTIEAYHDEKPVLSGGRRVVGWKASEEAGHVVWTAKLPQELPPGTVRELWVDGRRRVRSRRPARGYFSVEPTPGEKRGPDKRKGASEFTFLRDDLKAWPTAGDAEVVLMSKWVDSRLPVRSVDEADHRVAFTKHTIHDIEPGDAYWVEGAMDLLAEPGQWCADARGGEVRYLPLPGEKPEAVEAIVPALEQVVRLEGRPESGQYVDGVVFRGLTFAHTRCDLPEHDGTSPGKAGFHQAAIDATATVFGRGVSHCTFDRCTVEHTGGYGLELAGGCQHDRVTRCTITDLGAGGVKIGEQAMRRDPKEQTFDVEVSDCRITDGGLMFPSGVGLWVGQSYDDRLVHNEVSEFYYTAFSVGWRWGYAPALTRGVIVEHNDVHHIGVKHAHKADGTFGAETDGPILSDMGGIYTLGPQEGSVIRYNRFHDVAAIKYGGWGIYFDEGTSGILAEKNLVYRTTHGGLHQHYGRDNVFRNNVIAFGRERQVQRTRAEEHRSFTFERNLVYFESGTAVSGDWASFNAVFDHNVWWDFGKGQMKFAGMDWDAWRQKGMDADSVRADPGFTDPEHGDFRLRRSDGDSPAAKIGFEPWDMTDVGPRAGGGEVGELWSGGVVG